MQRVSFWTRRCLRITVIGYVIVVLFASALEVATKDGVVSKVPMFSGQQQQLVHPASGTK